MKLDAVRRYALSLDAVTEEPHHHFSSFRVRGKIFVTIPPGEQFIHVFVAEEDRELALAMHPAFIEKLLWGGKVVGLRVALAQAKPDVVKGLVGRAYETRVQKDAAPAKTRPGPASRLAGIVLALSLLAGTTTPMPARAAGVDGAVADTLRPCTLTDAQLSDAIDRVSDWPSLHAHQQAYFPPCPDEGAAAQAHSELVARTLAERWAETGELAAILRTAPSFRDFFFRHLNAQGGKGHLQAILSFATIRCPRQESRLCAEIRQTVGRALEKLQ